MKKKITEEWFDAVSDKDIETVKGMTKEGIDVNYKNHNGWTAIYYACYRGNIDIAKLLIDNGADINIQNNRLRTPLHIACTYGYIDIAKILIDNGADVIIKDKNGSIPLDDLKSYKEKHEELIEWLAEYHPDKALEVIASENSPSKSVGL